MTGFFKCDDKQVIRELLDKYIKMANEKITKHNEAEIAIVTVVVNDSAEFSDKWYAKL